MKTVVSIVVLRMWQKFTLETDMKKLCFCVFSSLGMTFSLFSCGPQPPAGLLQSRTIGNHQRPSCADSQTAQELGLEQKKQELFDAISKYHSRKEDRDKALKYYRNYVANLDINKCPERIKQLLQDIIDEYKS